MGPVTLLMAVHCHQPVGNFDFVLEEAYAKSYEPFVRTLEAHPGIRMALHYSGPLLDWLKRERPEFLKRLRALADSGRVEILGSGYYEPILPVIPERDRQGQIARMQNALAEWIGQPAGGLWLTERVWEPDLAATLSRAGIRYTILDSSQLETARPWLPEALQVRDDEFWDLLGCFRTDSNGEGVTVFPASMRLRYWMPFQEPQRTVDFLAGLRDRGGCSITFADDGEKFGFWPGTHKWVFEEDGWLDRFFAAVERESEWLKTATFREHLAGNSPARAVYAPSSSYREMMTWSAGSFRNFFLKYPEAQAMQQKMLRVSRLIERVQVRAIRQADGARGASAQSRLREATEALYAGQCNCAYWHGVFGGLYLAHLRRAVYRNLIAAESAALEAEALLDGVQGKAAAASMRVEDTDGDGEPEVLIQTPAAQLIVDPGEQGTITAWDLPRAGINLLDTLHRHHEPYHDNIRSKTWRPAGTPGDQAMRTDGGVTDREFPVVFDASRRTAFADYALKAMPDMDAVLGGWWREQILALPGDGKWRRMPEDPAAQVVLCRETPDGRLRKEITVDASGCRVKCRYAILSPAAPVLALEFNLAVRDPRYLQKPGELEAVSVFTVREPEAGVSLSVAIDAPARLYHQPIETISESEAGLERTYQGLSLLWCWTLPQQRPWSVTLEWTSASDNAPGPETGASPASAAIQREGSPFSGQPVEEAVSRKMVKSA